MGTQKKKRYSFYFTHIPGAADKKGMEAGTTWVEHRRGTAKVSEGPTAAMYGIVPLVSVQYNTRLFGGSVLVLQNLFVFWFTTIMLPN